MNALTLRHAHTVPAILANAGENAATKFLEFFAARIRNLNTREAYARACAQFLAWSEQHVNDIRAITPMHVAAYIEQHPGSPQTIKQHLAAIKMLFDYLVISQIVPVNPAAPVKGPTHVVKRGKTPVLSVEDARTLLDSIPLDSLQGLRDRALIGYLNKYPSLTDAGGVLVSTSPSTMISAHTAVLNISRRRQLLSPLRHSHEETTGLSCSIRRNKYTHHNCSHD